MKVIFCNVVVCSIEVYNFMLIKSRIEIFYISNIPNQREFLMPVVVFAMRDKNIS